MIHIVITTTSLCLIWDRVGKRLVHNVSYKAAMIDVFTTSNRNTK